MWSLATRLPNRLVMPASSSFTRSLLLPHLRATGWTQHRRWHPPVRGRGWLPRPGTHLSGPAGRPDPDRPVYFAGLGVAGLIVPFSISVLIWSSSVFTDAGILL